MWDLLEDSLRLDFLSDGQNKCCQRRINFGLCYGKATNSYRKRGCKEIDSVVNWKRFDCRKRARAIASLRRVKEIKQFLMSLFLSRLRVRNGTLLADIKVAVSLL